MTAITALIDWHLVRLNKGAIVRLSMLGVLFAQLVVHWRFLLYALHPAVGVQL